jgi:hypothetical protein
MMRRLMGTARTACVLVVTEGSLEEMNTGQICGSGDILGHGTYQEETANHA